MIKLLVIGSNGQLGWELDRQGRPSSVEMVSLDLPDVDITDPQNIRHAVMAAKPNLVVNAAAYTAVDKAEKEPEIAFAVNRDGAANLADACHAAGIPLIHVSTDYVFDGKKKDPYLETDPVSPLGVYGQSKADGEAEIRKRLEAHVIIRTAWLYGLHGNNFVKTMLRLAREKEEIRVVDDQYGCPTYAGDLAAAILNVADSLLIEDTAKWGTYHFCGSDHTTWFGFASKIIEMTVPYESLHLKTVRPIPTAEYPTPARRPENSVMDCSLLYQAFGIKPSAWEKSLERMLNEYYDGH